MKRNALLALLLALVLLFSACSSRVVAEESSGEEEVLPTSSTQREPVREPASQAAVSEPEEDEPEVQPTATQEESSKEESSQEESAAQQQEEEDDKEEAQAAAPSFTYRNQAVTGLYSFDYQNRSYQMVTEESDIRNVLTQLEGYTAPTFTNRWGQVGFLVVTEEDKYTINIPGQLEGQDDKTVALYNLSTTLNARYTRHAQWFAYMNTDRVERVTFSGRAGGTYTLDSSTYPNEVMVQVDTVSAESIAKVGTYLKRLQVNPNPQILTEIEGYRTPADSPAEYSMTLYFSGGITYSFFGEFVTIRSSDMGEQIVYTGRDEWIKGLRDLMAGLPEAQISSPSSSTFGSGSGGSQSSGSGSSEPSIFDRIRDNDSGGE